MVPMQAFPRVSSLIKTNEGIGKGINNLDKTDGLQSNEFNPRSSYKNSAHSLFFGGIKGLNIFNPENLNYNTKTPEVVISKFKLFKYTNYTCQAYTLYRSNDSSDQSLWRIHS